MTTSPSWSCWPSDFSSGGVHLKNQGEPSDLCVYPPFMQWYFDNIDLLENEISTTNPTLILSWNRANSRRPTSIKINVSVSLTFQDHSPLTMNTPHPPVASKFLPTRFRQGLHKFRLCQTFPIIFLLTSCAYSPTFNAYSLSLIKCGAKERVGVLAKGNFGILVCYLIYLVHTS